MVSVEAFAGDDAAREKPGAPTEVEVPWAAGENECAASVRVTDIVEAPAGAGTSRAVVVVMLAIARGSHAETSRYFATFVALPQP